MGGARVPTWSMNVENRFDRHCGRVLDSRGPRVLHDTLSLGFAFCDGPQLTAVESVGPSGAITRGFGIAAIRAAGKPEDCFPTKVNTDDQTAG